jgi:hypothetical protein
LSNFFKRKQVFSIFVLFILDNFIILHLAYLSPFFFLSLFFPFFSLHFFLEKILFCILYTWNIYHSTLDLFIHSFCSYCHSFVIYFFIYTFFKKTYYKKTKEIVFQCSNCNIVLFFYYNQNEFEILHVFINTYDLHYILLYISIDFLIQSYVFYSP